MRVLLDEHLLHKMADCVHLAPCDNVILMLTCYLHCAPLERGYCSIAIL